MGTSAALPKARPQPMPSDNIRASAPSEDQPVEARGNQDRERRVQSTVMLILALATAMLVLPTLQAPKQAPVFCAVGLQLTTVDGQMVALEDQNAPGPTAKGPCGDSDRKGVAGMNTLGFDCKLRDETGRVVATTTPNRADGLCGQRDPATTEE